MVRAFDNFQSCPSRSGRRTQATLRSRYNNPSLDVIMTQFKPTRCVFYSFMYSLTNRQGLLPIDTLRQKSRIFSAASQPWQVSRAAKKPLGEVRLSSIKMSLTAINGRLGQDMPFREISAMSFCALFLHCQLLAEELLSEHRNKHPFNHETSDCLKRSYPLLGFARLKERL